MRNEKTDFRFSTQQSAFSLRSFHMYGNGRPLGMRKRMQVLIAVVLLAWATQTLLHQWGFGAEIPMDTPVEKFVPGTDRYIAGATLEMRGDATIIGSEVRLKQV